MEYEVRYYFNSSKKNEIINTLNGIEGIIRKNRCYEKTMQFDHPNSNNSFYNKDIDGRFRIRVTKNDMISKCKISWKRRINSTTDTEVNKEEEVELNIKYEEYDKLMFIIINVLTSFLFMSYYFLIYFVYGYVCYLSQIGATHSTS